MPTITQTVSGYAVVPAWGGPDNFVNVAGRGWTDQQGLCQDDGRRFRLRTGRLIPFYVPITNPVIFDGIRLQANHAAITFELGAPAILTSFQVWDRTTNIFTSPPLAINGNFRRQWIPGQNAFDLPFDMPVQGSLAIKVSILAIAEAEVIFTGAGIRFHS